MTSTRWTSAPGPGGNPPVVVVSHNDLNSLSWVVVVVPGEDAALMTHRRTGILVTGSESGLPNDVRFIPRYIRSLDFGRFPAQPVGIVPAARMVDIDAALRIILELK